MKKMNLLPMGSSKRFRKPMANAYRKKTMGEYLSSGFKQRGLGAIRIPVSDYVVQAKQEEQ